MVPIRQTHAYGELFGGLDIESLHEGGPIRKQLILLLVRETRLGEDTCRPGTNSLGQHAEHPHHHTPLHCKYLDAHSAVEGAPVVPVHGVGNFGVGVRRVPRNG